MASIQTLPYSFLSQRREERLKGGSQTFSFKKDCSSWIERVEDVKALYFGGSRLERRLPNLLHSDLKDPDAIRKRTQALDEYTSHLGVCIHYYDGFMWSTKHPLSMRPGDETGESTAQDPILSRFGVNVGNGMSFSYLMQNRAKEALLASISAVLIYKEPQANPPQTLSEFQALPDAIRTRLFDAEHIYDWETNDQTGELIWARFGMRESVQADPFLPPVVQETFWISTADKIYTYRHVYQQNEVPNNETPFALVEEIEHSMGSNPAHILQMSEGECLGFILRAPQIAQWVARSSEAWFCMSTAYSSLILSTRATEPDEIKALPGNLLIVPEDTKVSRSTPAGESYTALKSKREEATKAVYSAANLPALDDQTKPWRSGDAKMLDLTTGQTTLKSYAARYKRFAEEIYNSIALGIGAKERYTASGFEQLDDILTDDFINQTISIGQVDWSQIEKAFGETFCQDLRKQTSLRVLPDQDEPTREKYAKEIEAADLEPPPVPTAPTVQAPGKQNQQALIKNTPSLSS